MQHSLRTACLAALSGIALTALFSGVRAQEPDPNQECISNAKQVGLALAMYVQDYDEVLPPMNKQAVFQVVTFPYVKNKSVYTCPVTQQPYAINSSLSYMPLAKIKSPAATPALWDAKAHGDGKFTVDYVDAHVKRESKKPVASTSSHPSKPPRKKK